MLIDVGCDCAAAAPAAARFAADSATHGEAAFAKVEGTLNDGAGGCDRSFVNSKDSVSDVKCIPNWPRGWCIKMAGYASPE